MTVSTGTYPGILDLPDHGPSRMHCKHSEVTRLAGKYKDACSSHTQAQVMTGLIVLGKAVLLCSGGQGKKISEFQAILEYRARPCLQKAVQKTIKYKDYHCKPWQRRVSGKLAMMEFHMAGDVWINIDCKV